MEPVSMAVLAQGATALLAPYLPDLLKKAGESAAGEMGKRALGSTWDSVAALWARLHPSIASNPSAQKAAERVARTPDDARAVGSLELELQDVLEANPQLATEIARLLEEARVGTGPSSVTVTASGARSVAIGGNVRGTSISTGDLSPQRSSDR